MSFSHARLSHSTSILTDSFRTEYISLLTRHVAKGRRENALSTAYRHLDRSAYWRAECERIKEDSRIAQEERLEALREIDSLKTKLGCKERWCEEEESGS